MPERRFGFYYTLGKFDENFNKKNDFCHCYGIFMTATLMPPNQIARAWGSKKHWDIFRALTQNEIQNRCPRCTYYTHNKIYENCIEDNKDNLLLDFI